MPRKKSRFSVSALLVTFLLLLMSSVGVGADQSEPEEHALFWSIQKNGRTVGYLLGTIHSEDPRVLEFSEEFLQLLRSNDVFAMELVPDLPTLARLTDYMHYPEGKNLEMVIGAERYQALSSALSVYKVPPDYINKMKPWAAMMTLSTPPPVTGFFMDLSLSLRASGSGLKVVGLETLEQQLSFLQDMPLEMQINLLEQAVTEFDQVTTVHDEMVDIYLKGDLNELQKMSEEQMLEAGEAVMAYFMDSGIFARNQRMSESLLKQLADKSVFAAVGALHLPGGRGLINLLRQQGFDMLPLAMPFHSEKEG